MMKAIDLRTLQEDAKRNNQVFCICGQVYTANELDQIRWQETSYENLKSCMCDIPDDLSVMKFDDRENLTLGELSEVLQDGIRHAIACSDYWREDWTR